MTDKPQPNYKLTKTMQRSREGCAMLRQIQALKDIPQHGVKKGDLGGYIEHERNLDQYDPCWVGETAQVCGMACVYDHAIVSGEAFIKGNAIVKEYATVKGLAIIEGATVIKGHSKVSGHVRMEGWAIVTGYATVEGNSYLYGKTYVDGKAIIRKGSLHAGSWRACMQIETEQGYCVFMNVGGEHGTLSAARFQDGRQKGIWVTRGCFSGTSTEFERCVKDKYPAGHPIRAEYLALLRVIKSLLDPMRRLKCDKANLKQSCEKGYLTTA